MRILPTEAGGFDFSSLILLQTFFLLSQVCVVVNTDHLKLEG